MYHNIFQILLQRHDAATTAEPVSYTHLDEFQSRFNDYYPEVKEVAEDKSTTTLNDGTIVKWTINPNENNNYQNKLRCV